MENNIIRFNTYKLERGGLLYDMYDQFNARVGDQGTPLVMQWLQGLTDTEVDLQAKELHFYATGQVGKYLEKLKDGTGYQMSADASQVEYEDRNAAGTMDHGITKVKLPKQFFPQEGIFYGYFGLKDAQGNTYTSINVWFRVLGGVPIMGAAIPYFSTRFDELMETCQGRVEDALAQLRQEYQDEVKKNEDMSAETRAVLEKLAASVGHIQSLINAGDVVPRTEYQKNKEATDTAVEANTKELQSHDAQLKQLTASPASDGTTEITNARIGTAEQSAQTYDTLGDAIRDQAGQATRAVKKSFEEWHAFPYKKEDNAAYSKTDKISTTSASIYYFNITGVPLLRIRTTVQAYTNIFTFLDAHQQILNYQRSDDKPVTVDYVVAPPSNAMTLVLGANPGMSNSKDFVTCFDKGLEIGKFYQGDLTDDTFYIEHGLNRASLMIDSDHYDNLITADDGYQAWDDHLGKWVSQLLVPQGSGAKSVVVRKADDSGIISTEMYSHFTFKQIPKSELQLKSYRNGLTDISDIFDLSYNTILQGDGKDSNYIIYGKDLPAGTRISSQFVTVTHNASWLIDLDDGYEVSFITAVMNSNGEIIPHDFYNNANVIKTAVNWVGGHVYENLYTQGTYAVVFRKKDGSPISVNTIWDHVRIYEVDNTVHFPDYYRSHMQDRVDTINAKLTSPDNFGFGFITDVHAEFNTKHFPALIDEVRTKTPVNEFLGGGDWATAWFDSSNDTDNKPELFHFFEELQQLFKGVPLLKTVGNHEWAYGANNAYNISTKELYGYYLRDEDKIFRDIHWGADHTYYYWDNQQAKCRYISLNVMDYPDVLKPDGQNNKEWYFKVSDTQINWLKATLNSVPDGYLVVIESHLVPLNADQFASFPAAKIGTTITNGEDLQVIASAYATKTGDFTGAKGDLLGWFGGHYHADDITVRNGVTYITTIADCMSVWDIKGAPQKTAGTVSEQAFDVATVDRANRKVNLIRIGDGSDRSFTY